jgi:hypothetical protein
MVAARKIDEQGILRRRALKSLMDSNLFQEAVAEVKQDIISQILISRPDQKDSREYGYLMYHTVDKILDRLTAYIGDLTMLKEKENG